jgi:hypothetical protein
MIALNINNEAIENFYKKECNGDDSTFIDTIYQYIEAHNIKKSIKQGMKEAKEIEAGTRKGQDLESFLDEL